MPEVTRALGLRGAELIFMPAGLDKRRLGETWRTLLWARAIAPAIVVSTQNLISPANRGLAIVTSPEAIRYDTRSPAWAWSRSASTGYASYALGATAARRSAAVPRKACCPSNGSAQSSTTLLPEAAPGRGGVIALVTPRACPGPHEQRHW